MDLPFGLRYKSNKKNLIQCHAKQIQKNKINVHTFSIKKIIKLKN